MREDVNFDEEERNQIENRLDLIYSLKRKYGNTISEILEFQNNVELEIHKIENLDEYHRKIKKEDQKNGLNMAILFFINIGLNVN